jgi:branched-chain amino acid transport system ATP-binding protein
MLLDVDRATVYYGKSMAVGEVSLNVTEGDIVSIIGANGAGKSTILRALAGLTPLSSGEIRFMGRKINGLNTVDLVKMGLILVPEGRMLFPYLSVIDNLKLGASTRGDKREIAQDLEEVLHLFPRLKERRNQKAGTLSGGEQQMVAIGRGLMARPKLFMMDEPSLGLAPLVIEHLGEVIRDINRRGVSVLLVEQNVHLALDVAVRGYALHTGRIVMDGDIAAMKASDVVKRAYLGG